MSEVEEVEVGEWVKAEVKSKIEWSVEWKRKEVKNSQNTLKGKDVCKIWIENSLINENTLAMRYLRHRPQQNFTMNNRRNEQAANMKRLQKTSEEALCK